MTFKRDYGAKGRVGISMPQANPTVEPEIGACLPPGVSMMATRLTSKQQEPRDRYREYFERLDTTLDSYDILKLDAFAFGCTASSYQVGLEEEAIGIAALSKKRGYPIITGGQALIAALKKLGAKKIAIGAPYPQWMIDMALVYYKAAGFEITNALQIKTHSADTRSIYDLTGADAVAAVKTMDTSGADVFVFTGSGMPSFQAILETQKLKGIPTISTNLCMGWQLCDHVGMANWGKGDHKLFNGWQDRIASL
jgi:maleate isomerase